MCGSDKTLDPVVYARNREGGPRSGGKSFSENPLKSAQKRSKNVSPRDGVTPSQQRALVALAEARSIVAAARTAGVGESSIRRWLREDERFQTKLRQVREEALSHASLRLQQGASRAVEAMLELIESKDRIEVGRACSFPRPSISPFVRAPATTSPSAPPPSKTKRRTGRTSDDWEARWNELSAGMGDGHPNQP